MLLTPALVLLVLSSALFGRERIAFRDVSHFYTPLYGYVAQRTSQQWLPLWNDRCQTGMPLVGECTTAVLYPVRYVLGRLPMTIERQIAWYVAVHLVLASVLASAAASAAGAGRLGQTLVGLVYPLSGSVFFLYCNPPFLVSAAWLPLALSPLVSPLASGTTRLMVTRGGVLAGLALAMMILGGDPQTSVHVFLVSVVVQLVRAGRTDRTLLGLTKIAAAAVACLLLSAPQWIAGLSWALQSDRLLSGVASVQSSRFSIAPWHFAELITPNLFGSLFPVYQRISVLIPGDGAMWTPTLFMGSLPALMLIDRVVRPRRSSGDVWLLIAAAAGLFAMGPMGVAWTAMQQYLPGYDAFRYPAKWLPFFSLGVAIASGVWVESQPVVPPVKSSVVLIGLLATALVTVGASTLTTYPWSERLSWGATDVFWGPLDAGAALLQISKSLAWSILSVSALCVIGFCSVTKGGAMISSFDRSCSRCGVFHPVAWALVAISAIELAGSASWQLATVSVDRERRLMEKLQSSADAGEAGRVLRVQRGDVWPSRWRTTASKDRLRTVEAYQRASLLGRWHLSGDATVINNMVTIQSAGHSDFWQSIRKLNGRASSAGDVDVDDSRVDWDAVCRWLCVDRIHAQSSGLVTAVPTGQSVGVIQTFSQWRQLSTKSVTPAKRKQHFDRIASGAADVPLLTTNQSPRFETPDDNAYNQSQPRPGPPPRVTAAKLVSRTPEEVLVTVRTDHPVLLVRPVFQDGHWIAQRLSNLATGVRGHQGESPWLPCQLGQVDYLKQGTVVPPGNWQVRFRYRPWWRGGSLAIMLSGWAIVLGILIRSQWLVIRHQVRSS